MSTEKLVLIVAVALAAATLALARNINLEMALNKAMCPTIVEMDENTDRVPKRIKVLKCAPEPNRLCNLLNNKLDAAQLEWCQHSMECVEMRDTVVVYYRSKAKWDTYDVSVGCVCISKNSTKISDLKPSASGVA